MDKYEYTVKTEKIKKLAEKKDYASAAKLADTIDWSKVQDVRSLSLAADAYERCKRYADAKDLLCVAYELAPAGRRMLYRLTELSIKEGKMDEAEDFFREYRELAPGDEGQYILLYEMAVAKNEPLEKQITILEAYRKKEFDERWAFELARLYSRAGNQKACVRLCDEIILWFGFGKYVDKAMALKQNFEPLSQGQLEKIEQRREAEARVEEEKPEAPPEERPKKKKKKTKKEKTTETKGKSAAREKTAESRAKEEEKARALLYKTSEEIEQEIALTMEGVFAPAAEVQKTEEETTPSPYSDGMPPEKDWSDPVYSTPVFQEETASYYTDDSSYYSREAVREQETEWTAPPPMDEMLRKVLITADQFDADGFVPDLDKTREFVPPKVPEETRELKELSRLREEGMLPQIDLDCVRKTAEEEQPKASNRREEPVSAMVPEEKTDQTKGVFPETSADPDDAEEEISAFMPEITEEEEVIPDTEPEQAPHQEEESIPETTMPERKAFREEEPVPEMVRSEPERSEENESLPEIVVPKPKNSKEESRIPEIVVPEPRASRENTRIPEVEEEEPIKYGPIFACILMESGDVTKAVSRAIDLIKKKHNLLGTMASQAAKISGFRLNKKGMKSSLEKLNGRDLIIEGAGVLDASLLKELLEELRHPTMDGVVVLADEPEGIRRLAKRCPGLERMCDYVEDQDPVPAPAAQQLEQIQRELDAKARAEKELRQLMEERARARAEREAQESAAFQEVKAASNARLQPEPEEKEPEVSAEETLQKTIRETEQEAERGRTLTMQEFAQYIEKYAFEMECVLDDRAGLAIYAAAERMLDEGEELTEENARELADDAIELAEKPSFRRVFSGKYDKNGYLILREHHFSE